MAESTETNDFKLSLHFDKTSLIASEEAAKANGEEYLSILDVMAILNML